MAAADPPPFLRHDGDPALPLVIAVPHAGRHYPAAIERDRAVPAAVLEQIEDRHADRLIAPLIAAGATAIVATHARAWIDLNRGEADLDSARERGGLGLIPSRLAGRPLWRSPPSRDGIADRLATIHRPYHAAIAAAVATTLRRHGRALLIDCHSMPPLDRGRPGGARIVIGDRHGASAGGHVTAAALHACKRRGITAARNAPYAGAYTLERHGRPTAGVHAMQVEIDRSLYLDAALRMPAAGLAATSALLAEIVWAALAAIAPPHVIAAE